MDSPSETARYIKLLAGAAMCLMILPAQAVAATCDFEKGPIEFEFTEMRAEVTLDHSKNSVEIEQLIAELPDAEEFHNRLKTQAEQVKRNGGAFVFNGYTYGSAEMKLKFGYRVATMTDDSYCAYINRVDMAFGNREMRVYLSNEHAKGSCRYKVTLDHEMEHVRHSKDVLTRFVKKMKKLQEYVRAMPIRNGREIDQVKQELRDQFISKIKEIGARFDHEVKTVNNELDTMENYQRMDALCS